MKLLRLLSVVAVVAALFAPSTRDGRAGVDLIVNRWRVAYRAPGAETIDVTDLLVQAFHPDEKALAIVAQIGDRGPLPLYDTDWEGMRDH